MSSVSNDDDDNRRCRSSDGEEHEHELGPVANTHKQSADDYLIGVAGKLTRVGYYTLSKTLGKGKYGKVKLGTHDFTGEKVAVKCIDKSKLRKEDLALLYREVRVHGLMDHPNIMRLYEVLDTSAELCLVLEYCGGGELYDYVVERGHLSEDEARRLYRQIISAVSYIHSLGVVHRDLKLENVQMDSKGNCKVGDFGFSRFYTPHSWLLRSCGSPKYLCPEILSGAQYRGPEVDVYSLGVMLYALMVGKMPFDSIGYGKEHTHERLSRMETGEVDPSPLLTDSCLALIKRLVTERSRRASMPELLADAWVCGTGGPVVAPVVTQHPFDAMALDDVIVQRMNDMGWERREINDALRPTRSPSPGPAPSLAMSMPTIPTVSPSPSPPPPPDAAKPIRLVYGLLWNKKRLSLDYREKGAPLLVVDGADADESAMSKEFANDFFSIYEEVGQGAPRPRSPLAADYSAGAGGGGASERSRIRERIAPINTTSSRNSSSSRRPPLTGTPKSARSSGLSLSASTKERSSKDSGSRKPDVFTRLASTPSGHHAPAMGTFSGSASNASSQSLLPPAPSGRQRSGSLSGDQVVPPAAAAAAPGAVAASAERPPKAKGSTMVKMSSVTSDVAHSLDPLPEGEVPAPRKRSDPRPTAAIPLAVPSKGLSTPKSPRAPTLSVGPGGDKPRRASYDSGTISSQSKHSKARPPSGISTIVPAAKGSRS